MQSGDAEGIPKLAPGRDPTSLEMSAAEGFLLSRIDGHTNWRLLREIGGLPPDEVDQCIERWIEAGVIELQRPQPKTPAKPQASPAPASSKTSAAKPSTTRTAASKPPAAGSNGSGARGEDPALAELEKNIDESLLDEALDLDLDVQRRILAFEDGLDRDYFSILHVSTSADNREIKKVYFKLSRDFHPDRYFRREIGHYLPRLERIFKKVLEAYELLSDPIARAEIEKSLPPPPQPVANPGASEPKPIPAKPLTARERLRQRMPFRIPEGLIEDRREKAADLFKAAERYFRVKNYLEASSSMRLAIAFDPYNSEYKVFFAEVQARSADARASQLLQDSARGSFSNHEERKEALKLFEEVILYRPHDPEINSKAARVALDLEEVEKAREYIERALEHSPDVAEYHVIMGQVHHAAGSKGHAVREFEAALKLEPGNADVRQQIAKLRGGRGRAVRGGM